MAIAGAIIVAAGSASRMKGVDKIFLEVAGMPVLAHTIRAFQDSRAIGSIVVVLSAANIVKGKELVKKYRYDKVRAVCEGGSTRQQSVGNGLKLIGNCNFILVQDGARPCVTNEIIEQGIANAAEEGVAVAAAHVTDTIKRVDNENRVVETLDRNELRAIQTPQVFRADILRKVHENPESDLTDDAGLAEKMGYTVNVYMTSKENMKITTIEDIAVVESILGKRIRDKAQRTSR